MDTLTRWSIAFGTGAVAGILLLSGYALATAGVKHESYGAAIDRLVPDQATLDATVAYTTYNLDDMSQYVERISNAGLEQRVDCGGYGHPAHVCTIDATIPGALTLRNASTPIFRDDITLTVGEYSSPYEDILATSQTITAQTDNGPQNVTFEGGGVFELSYLDRVTTTTDGAPWQYALSTVPMQSVWGALAALVAIITVLAAAVFRPQRAEPIEETGIDAFDTLYEPQDARLA